jgi:hypothetical protein
MAAGHVVKGVQLFDQKTHKTSSIHREILTRQRKSGVSAVYPHGFCKEGYLHTKSVGGFVDKVFVQCWGARIQRLTEV